MPLWTVGHLVSVALHNQRLLQEVREASFAQRRTVAELETLYDVGLTLTSSLQMEAVTEEVLQRAAARVDARAGFLS